MRTKFLLQHILFGELTLEESMLNSIEFIRSQIRLDLTPNDIQNLINTIDYRWKDDEQ
jgi:hypothetical protein